MQASRKSFTSAVSLTVAGLVMATLIVGLSACNTTKGVGEDIEKAGAGLQRSADRNGAD
ncbi:entericidin A/B family lipoprotein [Synechococcus sp. Cruz CV-v-12]|uniref:entericidin A/B family lipoprotein n=1 Tax=Synechococcus sp. Cruz CV-v-12 TaxID=2823728 RepID=UPI0020CC2830|nr:entericidin A/B family lipoprotein [Synechococcus sp. Cruz CV-v-12]MCP9874387.1 entericidin A/B family lipoprotein [Synechococcus sp. Cruz CV-v-12]